jgi:hypothetical protein
MGALEIWGVSVGWDATPLASASLSFETMSAPKYFFSSHNRIRFSIFALCFGQLSKAAALATRPGRTPSHNVANLPSPFLLMTW